MGLYISSWRIESASFTTQEPARKEVEPVSSLAEYFAFAQEHPEVFVNPPQGGFTVLLEEKEIREVEAQMRQKLAARGLSVAWSQVGIEYQDQYGRILRDVVLFPGGVIRYLYSLCRRAWKCPVCDRFAILSSEHSSRSLFSPCDTEHSS